MSSGQAPAIVWFRRDLRLADNEALTAAAESGRPLVACYTLDDPAAASGAAGRAWRALSIDALAKDLAASGIPLVLRRGDPIAAIVDLAQATGAAAVHAVAVLEPAAETTELALRRALMPLGVVFHRHRGQVLYADLDVRTRQGKPHRVFTPFWRACRALPESALPLPAPQTRVPFTGKLNLDGDGSLDRLVAERNDGPRLTEAFRPGEEGAHARLERFIADELEAYARDRDRPDLDVTSRLSPHLHFGELSPRQVWHAVGRATLDPGRRHGAGALARELGWREFACHLLGHWPTSPSEPLREAFAAFPWRDDAGLRTSWQRGETGYPIVDAGMRQLRRIGWMHNRVRMIVASFLVKDLLVPWQRGADWFLEQLVDADLATNSASWQWVAGCGADAAPYFRIFNPVLQGRRFDPGGDYVRRWVPELESLPAAHIHAPWEAPRAVLAQSGISLGADYPMPIVDHAEARRRALALYRTLGA